MTTRDPEVEQAFETWWSASPGVDTLLSEREKKMIKGGFYAGWAKCLAAQQRAHEEATGRSEDTVTNRDYVAEAAGDDSQHDPFDDSGWRQRHRIDG